MSFKGIVSTILLLFVGVCIVYVVLRESGVNGGAGEASPAAAETAIAESAGSAEAVEAQPDVIAYYFHGQMRCRKCMAIEKNAKEALEMGFAEAWESGRLVWRKVDTTKPGNEHFVEDYEITTSSVVLVAMEEGQPGKWKKLERVWELVDDYLNFGAYVQEEAQAFLEEGA